MHVPQQVLEDIDVLIGDARRIATDETAAVAAAAEDHQDAAGSATPPVPAAGVKRSAPSPPPSPPQMLHVRIWPTVLGPATERVFCILHAKCPGGVVFMAPRRLTADVKWVTRAEQGRWRGNVTRVELVVWVFDQPPDAAALAPLGTATRGLLVLWAGPNVVVPVRENMHPKWSLWQPTLTPWRSVSVGPRERLLSDLYHGPVLASAFNLLSSEETLWRQAVHHHAMRVARDPTDKHARDWIVYAGSPAHAALLAKLLRDMCTDDAVPRPYVNCLVIMSAEWPEQSVVDDNGAHFNVFILAQPDLPLPLAVRPVLIFWQCSSAVYHSRCRAHDLWTVAWTCAGTRAEQAIAGYTNTTLQSILKFKTL